MSEEKATKRFEEEALTARLFDDFTAPTYEEWKEAAVASLKGAPFEKKVYTRTYEDITLQPIYTEEDIQDLPHMGSLPGLSPYVRGTEATGYIAKPWDISQEISAGDPKEFNRAVLHDLDRGLTGLNIRLDYPTLHGRDADLAGDSPVGKAGLSVSTLEDLEAALSGVYLEALPVHVFAGVAALPLSALFFALIEKQGKSPADLKGIIGADPLGELAREGALVLPLETAYDIMAGLASWHRANAPGLRTILVRGNPYHDAGCSAVQELAWALATGVEYIRALTDRGLTVDDIVSQIGFSFSVGQNLFMEIAKLRAAKMLWANVVDAFGGNEESQKIRIHARTSARTKTIHDPYVNMLRNTTEAFAGIVGGVDSLDVCPFDEPIRPANDFSRRVSRNVQILLLNECRLTHPVDPAGGSWYVEYLTDQVAQKAWGLFQEIEARGGMFQALMEGLPQQAAADVAQKKAADLAVRKNVIVGTNQYPNLLEKPLEQPDIDYEALRQNRADQVAAYRSTCGEGKDGILKDLAKPSGQRSAAIMEKALDAVRSGATLGDLFKSIKPVDTTVPAVTALCIHRQAEEYEKLRRNMEIIQAEAGRPIQVFLANMGPIPQHKARADFTTGFFQVGGFEVLSNNGFETIDRAAEAALASGAPIVVICSTDPTYPDIVPPLTRAIKAGKPDTIVILAGKPAKEHEDSYREAGLDDFIFIRSNCLEMLLNLQKRSGLIDE